MFKSGFFYAILTAMVWGCAPVLDKIAMQHIGPKLAIVVRNIVIFFATLPLFIFFFKDIVTDSKNLTLKLIVILGTGGVIGGLIGLTLYFKAIKMMEASKVVPISSTYPLFAMILAWLFLGESITITKFIGTVMVIIGIVLISI